jgi:arylsulfatase A-like enzyme
LHDEAVRFTDFHVSPTCAPTRSALLSGRHEFKNGVTHTILERERMSLKTVTLSLLWFNFRIARDSRAMR